MIYLSTLKFYHFPKKISHIFYYPTICSILLYPTKYHSIVCQLEMCFLWAPNLPFIALLSDTEAGPYEHFSFASCFSNRLCNRGSEKALPYKARDQVCLPGSAILFFLLPMKMFPAAHGIMSSGSQASEFHQKSSTFYSPILVYGPALSHGTQRTSSSSSRPWPYPSGGKQGSFQVYFSYQWSSSALEIE